MHYDNIEDYNFPHNSQFDSTTGEWSSLMPHDLDRPLTHEEMDYNLCYQKQTLRGFRIAGSATDLTLTDDDLTKALQLHKITGLELKYPNWNSLGYVAGQYIWHPGPPAIPEYLNLTSNITTTGEPGGPVTFTLTSNGIADGATLPWQLTGTGLTNSDVVGGALSGIFTVNGDTATVDVTVVEDFLTEGIETWTMTTGTVDSNGITNGLPLSQALVVNDTSLTPSYDTLVGSPTPTNEGNFVSFALSTTNIADGTTVAYTLSGISTADISLNTLTGSLTINNNSASLAMQIIADNLTEGSETMTMTLSTVDSGGIATNNLSASINIIDSSTTPVYAITYDANGGTGTTSTTTGTLPLTIAINGFTRNNYNFTNWNTASDGTGTTYNPGDSYSGSANLTLYAVWTLASAYTTFTGPATRLEGQTASYVVNSVNVPDGTQIGYTITGVDVADISLNSLTGFITMNDFMGNQQAGQLQFSILEDYTVESDETMVITLDTQDSAGITAGLPMSRSTIISDVAPTYEILGQSPIIEGETQTYTFRASNMVAGTTVYWELRNFGSSSFYTEFADDISSPRTGSGQVVQVGNNVELDFDITVANDYTSSEGSEYFKIVVWDDASNYATGPNFDGAVSGALATKEITIQDLNPQWQLTTVGDPVAGGEDDQAEPEVLTFNILTRYVPVGTPFTWEAKPYGTDPAAAADFNGGTFPTGSGTVSAFNNSIALDSQFTTSVIADNTTEGVEQYILELSDANGVVASKVINITDNSQDPLPEQWQISAASSQNEGSTLQFDVQTQDVPAQSYTYQIVASGANPASAVDFQGSSFPSGSGNVAQLNTTMSTDGTHSITVVDDLTTEGAETYTIEVYNAGNNLVASHIVTINDTSVTPTYTNLTPQTVTEGQDMTFTLSTANMPNGTTVQFVLSGTATSGSDYTVPGALEFTINNNTATYTITTIEDLTTEGNETVIMTLNGTDSAGNSTGALTATGAIIDTSIDPTYTVETLFNHSAATTNHEMQTPLNTDVGTSHTITNSNLAAGSTVSHTVYLVADAGWEFDYSGLQILLGGTPIDLNNQPSGITITNPSPTQIRIQRDYVNIQANANSTVNITGVPMLQVFDCNYAGLVINISNGTVGDAVNFSVSIDGNPPANLPGINPATYQNGTTTYDVTFDIPAGFANSGQITCQASGTGTAPQLNRTLYYFHAGQSTVPYAADMTAAGTTFYINGGNGTSTDLSVAMQDIIANSGNQYYGTVSSFTMPQGTNITANGNATQWTYPTTTVSEPYYIAVPDNADFPEDLLTGNHLVDLGNNQPTNASSMATFTDANGENYKLYKLAAASGIGGPTYSFV